MKRVGKLSREEAKIEKSLDSGEWKSVSKDRINSHVKSAKKHVRTAKKEGRINLRITDEDLKLIKKKAESEGLPYQTFMASILHKYVSGHFVDRKVISELEKIMLRGKTGSQSAV